MFRLLPGTKQSVSAPGHRSSRTSYQEAALSRLVSKELPSLFASRPNRPEPTPPRWKDHGGGDGEASACSNGKQVLPNAPAGRHLYRMVRAHRPGRSVAGGISSCRRAGCPGAIPASWIAQDGKEGSGHLRIASSDDLPAPPVSGNRVGAPRAKVFRCRRRPQHRRSL